MALESEAPHPTSRFERLTIEYPGFAEVLLQISEITGTPLDEVIVLVKCETEKDAKRREVWDAYIKRLGGLAASVFVCVVTATNFAVEKAIQLALLSP